MGGIADRIEVRVGVVYPRFVAPPSGWWRCVRRGPGVVAALDPRLPSGTPTGVGRAGRRAVGVRNGAGLQPGRGDEPPGLSVPWSPQVRLRRGFVP